MRMLSDFDDGEGIARLVEEIVGDQVGVDAAALALALLGVEGVDELEAPRELHRLARTEHPSSRLRVAVALLMGRAEAAFAKEHGDWKERENVCAHFRHLVAYGYHPGASDAAQLATLFGIDSLDAPVPGAGLAQLPRQPPPVTSTRTWPGAIPRLPWSQTRMRSSAAAATAWRSPKAS